MITPQPTQETKMRIASKIQYAIRSKNLSIRQTGEMAGINISHLAKFIRTECPIPKPEFMDKLIAVLDLPFVEIFYLAGYFDDFQLDKKILNFEVLEKLEISIAEVYSALLKTMEFKEGYWDISFAQSVKSPEDWLKQFIRLDMGISHRWIFDEPVELVFALHNMLKTPMDLDLLFYIFNQIPSGFFSSKITTNFAKNLDIFRKSLEEAVVLYHEYKESTPYPELKQFWRDYFEIVERHKNEALLKAPTKPEKSFSFEVADRDTQTTITIVLPKAKALAVISKITDILDAQFKEIKESKE